MKVPPKIIGLGGEKIIIIERQEHSFDKMKNKKISIYVLSEIIINDVYNYFKENNVELVEYKDRTKYGIPSNDEYLIQGILKTYLWKIQGRESKNILFGNNHIKIYCEEFPKFKVKIIYLKNIIDNLDDDLVSDFIKELWDSSKNDFNYEIINEYRKREHNNKQR